MAMNKTQATDASVDGFGSYHYRCESGREGDSSLTGFAARKGDISVYLMASGQGQGKLLNKLGRHKMGKAFLYLRKLSDVDMKVLEQLIAGSVAEVRRRYGQAGCEVLSGTEVVL
jgi:hypothetical protein